MTSKKIARKASKLGRKAKTYAEREVAMSALAQARKRKPARKKTIRKRVGRR
jgi:hypothetical protein